MSMIVIGGPLRQFSCASSDGVVRHRPLTVQHIL
jgi:hypothetical protein